MQLGRPGIRSGKCTGDSKGDCVRGKMVNHQDEPFDSRVHNW